MSQPITAKQIVSIHRDASDITVQRILAIVNQEIDGDDPCMLDWSPQTAAWIDDCYHSPSNTELAIHALDCLLECYGVESVSINTGDSEAVNNGSGEHLITYCNAGDTFNSTIAWDYAAGAFIVTTLGDIVESLETEHASSPA